MLGYGLLGTIFLGTFVVFVIRVLLTQNSGRVQRPRPAALPTHTTAVPRESGRTRGIVENKWVKRNSRNNRTTGQVCEGCSASFKSSSKDYETRVIVLPFPEESVAPYHRSLLCSLPFFAAHDHAVPGPKYGPNRPS